MYLGRIVEQGPTEKVLSAPKHPYTQALLSVVPEIDHVAPIVLTGEPPDPTAIPTGCRFHPRCPALRDGQAQAVAADCTGRALPVLSGQSGHEVACWLAGTPVSATRAAQPDGPGEVPAR
jgi:peptide/nickel transport system ATP-binding protein